MISILLPSRKRPDSLRRMVESARATSTTPLEFVVYFDDDDPESLALSQDLGLVTIVGPRRRLGEYWNECYNASTGEIVLHAGDDLIFRTDNWDQEVYKAFALFPDKILLVHGSDAGMHERAFGSILFTSRKWVDTVGYFTSVLLCGDKIDDWLNDVANLIHRRMFIPIVIQHMHPIYGTAPDDDTYRERRDRQQREDVWKIYNETAHLREIDAAKLKAVMST